MDTIEALDERNWRITGHFYTSVRRVDASHSRKVQGEDLAAGDVSIVLYAWKFGNCQRAILINHRSLWP